MADPHYSRLPFDEAIDFFRQKVNLPTEKWTDLREGMHSRAFVVAGAAKSELLSDLRRGVDKAIADGTTISEFLKDFDSLVQKNGWNYKGKRGWRSSVIYQTNLRAAYAAGHYQQMTDPDILRTRPYWMYIGGLSEHPRQLHLAWSGTVLPATDSWWDTHFVPNGWGCKCKIRSLSRRALERKGLKVADQAPDSGSYTWKNPDTGESVQVPAGIDPGWAYNPGKSAWGKQLSQETMTAWQAQGGKAWERLSKGDWKSYGRPQLVPSTQAKAAPDFRVGKTPEAIEQKLKKVLGGEEKIFSFKRDDFRYDVLVNAESLAGHVPSDRTPYLSLLPETLEDPYEVWLSFEKHKGTGKTVLRQRIIKMLKINDKDRGMLVTTNVVNGIMETWTVIPTSDPGYLNNQRVGKLIWKRE